MSGGDGFLVNNSRAGVFLRIGSKALFFIVSAGILAYFPSVPPTQEIICSPDGVGCINGPVYVPKLLDATWFAIQTVTTTGYGSLPVWTDCLKIVSIALMILAVPVWTMLLGLAINLVDRALHEKSGTAVAPPE